MFSLHPMNKKNQISFYPYIFHGFFEEKKLNKY